MPTGIRDVTARVTTGFVDTVNDQFPGGGSASPGLASGQVGVKVTLGVNAAAISNTLNQYEGVVQYVQTLSTDTTAPLIGYSAFWSDRANYKVTTDGATAGIENWAGIFLGTVTPGNFCYIKLPEGGRTLVNFSGVTPAAGQQAVATTGVAATTAASTTAIKSYHIGTCQGAKVSGDLAVVAFKGGEV